MCCFLKSAERGGSRDASAGGSLALSKAQHKICVSHINVRDSFWVCPHRHSESLFPFLQRISGFLFVFSKHFFSSPAWRGRPSREALLALQSLAERVHTHLQMLLTTAISLREERERATSFFSRSFPFFFFFLSANRRDFASVYVWCFESG